MSAPAKTDCALLCSCGAPARWLVNNLPKCDDHRLIAEATLNMHAHETVVTVPVNKASTPAVGS